MRTRVQRQITAETKNEIIEAYQNETLSREMLQRMGLHREEVYQILKDAGVIGEKGKVLKIKKQVIINEDTEIVAAIIKAYRCALTIKQIAEKFDFSWEYVREILVQNGMEIRKYNSIEDPKRIKELVSDYLNGMNWYEMQEKYEVSHKVIALTLQKANVSLGDELKDFERDLNVALREPITVEKMFEIKTAYEDGAAMQKVCKNYKITHKTLSRILKKLDVVVRPGKFPLVITDELLAAVKEAHNKGMSKAEIQHEFNLNPGTCYNIFRMLKLDKNIRKKNVLNDPQAVELVIREYKSGKTINTIAKTYYFYESTVSQALKNAGIKVSAGKKGAFSSEEKVDELISEYKKGTSFEAMEKKFGVSIATIQRNLKRNGVSLVRNKNPLLGDDSQTKNVIDEYSKGYTLKETADRFDVSVANIREVLKSAGVKIRGSRRYLSAMSETQRKEKIAELIVDYNNGVEWEILVKKYHLNIGNISKILKEAGVPFRKSKT